MCALLQKILLFNGLYGCNKLYHPNNRIPSNIFNYLLLANPTTFDFMSQYKKLRNIETITTGNTMFYFGIIWNKYRKSININNNIRYNCMLLTKIQCLEENRGRYKIYYPGCNFHPWVLLYAHHVCNNSKRIILLDFILRI